MTGGKRPARPRGAINRPNKSGPSKAVFCANALNFRFSNNTTHLEKLILCHCLKTIRHFKTEAAAILLDQILRMETRGRVGILPIQQIVYRGRKLEVFDEILAK